MKIAINGFGRIGRQFLRLALARQTELEIVALNDLVPRATLAHLLEFDSVYGRANFPVQLQDNCLRAGPLKIQVLAERDPEELPWQELGVELVIEASGLFTQRAAANKHLTAGAQFVLISAPGKEVDLTVVRGVNDQQFNSAQHKIISNASCTTNCLAPVAKVLHENFRIQKGLLTTTHAYTSDQRLIDSPHKDLRRARAAALNIIPTSTGAAQAVGEVLPELRGKLTGLALRVPTPTVSVVDFVAEVAQQVTAEQVNASLRAAAEQDLAGILAVEERPLVSSDYIGSSLSSIVDAASTLVVGENLVKVISWYDNEFGYANRLVELAEIVGAATP